MPRLWVPIITVVLLAGSAVGVAAQEDPTSRPPIPSAGCGISKAEAGKQTGQAITVGASERKWTMHVPTAHDGLEPIPLWLQLHGSGGSGFEMSSLSSQADDHGIVVAWPRASVGNDRWMWWVDDIELDTSLSNPDIAFIDALIEHLGEELCVDLARVYASGYSAGAAGVSILGCALDDRLAAVAPVARVWELGEACDAVRPVPHLAVLGKTDGTCLWEGGLGWAARASLPMVQLYDQTPMPSRMAGIAARNGCEPEPLIEAIEGERERWNWACPVGAEVELIVHDGGHTWMASPWGPYPTTTEMVWEFFEQHALPE